VNRDLVCDGRNVVALDLRIVKVIEIVEDRDVMSISE